MKPCTMLYKEDDFKDAKEVTVYDIIHTHDAEGVIRELYMICWDSKLESWITAPIWCFKPISTKKVLEE